MYLIYVDEYGTSGGRLDNPNEPYFALQAAIVDEKHWTALERDMLALQVRVTQELSDLGRPITRKFEFHAVELLQGKGNFSGLPIERQLFYAEQLLRIAAVNHVRYMSVGVEKSVLHQMIRDTFVDETIAPNMRDAHTVLRARFSPYSMCFCYLLASINRWLSQEIDRGLLIFDENSQYGKLATLGSYAFSRTSNGHIANILAAPFFTDSKIHTPLQIADLVSYLQGRKDVAEIRGQAVRPSIIDTWLKSYIEPFDVASGIILGSEIKDLTIGILEEMWPAQFDEPLVQDYCDQLTRNLAILGEIGPSTPKNIGDETPEGLAPVT